MLLWAETHTSALEAEVIAPGPCAYTHGLTELPPTTTNIPWEGAATRVELPAKGPSAITVGDYEL